MDRAQPGRGVRAGLVTLLGVAIAAPSSADPNPFVVDLAGVSTAADTLVRVYGSEGDGFRGVPVAGGFDVDGDGFVDFAMASMLASPVVSTVSRPGAGEVYLVFGDGTGCGGYDTAIASADILRFVGVVEDEAAGSEIWMDDVTGDGKGDLLSSPPPTTIVSAPAPIRPGSGV